MEKKLFKRFVNTNKLESHRTNCIDSCDEITIADFQKLLKVDSRSDEFITTQNSLTAEMGDDYFAIDVRSVLLNRGFEEREIKEIFPEKNNNI